MGLDWGYLVTWRDYAAEQLGLGLAIVRDTVLDLGGDVDAGRQVDFGWS